MSVSRLLGAAMIMAVLTGSRAQAAPIEMARDVPGLAERATIVVDHWGIAHIFAASERDAYFLQGYNAARDRLWQIDLWRKRGLGLLSASLGPSFVAQDRAARLLLYRGDMAKEWAAYAPGVAGTMEAFTAGINAYVLAVRRGEQPLPIEFKLTQSAPDLWRPEDVVRIRGHALVANLTSEVARAQVVCAAGAPADALRRKLEPPHALRIPLGLDPCTITADVLKDYVLGTEPVAFSPTGQKVAVMDTSGFIEAASGEGSNNWVVAADRTATGRPIMANDPHRQLGAPSLRYLVQLSAPGLSIIGAGEPSLPGISFGHNEDAAFGLTIFGIDQEDLYVYDLNPADPNQYRYGDGWETMTVERQYIPVKGEASKQVELRFTRHGPVLWYDPVHGHAFALRTVWSEPGASGYLQASWLTHATQWSDFVAARDHWGAPPLNLVYADTKGAIGWLAAGLTPVRPNWDGLLPVPGAGRYEWQGFLKGSDLPGALNPSKGWFATANEMNLPADYPSEARKVSFEWSDRSRIDRISEVLGANAKLTVADSMARQTDSHNAISKRLTALLNPLTSEDPQMAQALALLTTWDHDESTTSVAAAIYEVWAVKYLGRLLVQRVTPRPAWDLIGAGSLSAVISYLEQPDARLGDEPVTARNAILLASLAEALQELTAKLGPDMTAWQWGRLHHATFAPAVAVVADPRMRARMTLGPLPLPGGASTPKAATWRPTDFNTIAGASVRLVMDVGDWDRSMVINTPGQSDDPESPHYGDLFPIWARGGYVPLLFSRKAVNREAETVISLRPAP